MLGIAKQSSKCRECIDVKEIKFRTISLMIEYLEKCKSKCAFFTSRKLTKLYVRKHKCENVKYISTIIMNLLFYLCDANIIDLVTNSCSGLVYVVCKDKLDKLHEVQSILKLI